MNNEPVGWIDKNTGKPRMEGFIQTDHDIPLYTHPVKELTDEEIKTIYGEYFDIENFDWLHLQCIQSILRKASEK